MARTSNRYNALQGERKEKSESEKKKYRTALYARISVETIDKPSETIENQLDLMKGFIKNRDEFVQVREYVDRNYTGTNFQRPAFEELMEDVRKGVIQCILVKDLSRLGRDFLETSNYIEIIFPFLNVRFISVNDHYDSLEKYCSNKSLEITMKNLVNDLYARDVSTRISMVVESKFKKGIYQGIPPYGYKFAPNDPNRRFVIDPEPAAIVRDIFMMALAGKNMKDISIELQKRKICIPGEYKKLGKIKAVTGSENTKWYVGSISNILHNESYIGNLVLGKRRKSLTKGEKSRAMPKEEWKIVEGTHEPIVSKEVYDKVQDVIKRKLERVKDKFAPTSDSKKKPDKYKDLIYCGICHSRLEYCYQRSKKPSYFYRCRDRYDINKEPCRVQIGEKILDMIVKDHLTDILEKYNQSCHDLIRIIEQKEKRELKPVRHEKNKLNQFIQDCEVKNGENYESYVTGMLTKEDFLTKQIQYKKDQQEAEMKVLLIEKQIEEYTERVENEKTWLCSLDEFADVMELNFELLHALISRINVYPKHEIEIIYKFRKEDISDE